MKPKGLTKTYYDHFKFKKKLVLHDLHKKYFSVVRVIIYPRVEGTEFMNTPLEEVASDKPYLAGHYCVCLETRPHSTYISLLFYHVYAKSTLYNLLSQIPTCFLQIFTHKLYHY